MHAAARLRRALAVLPYVAAHGEVSVGELARVFGMTEDVIRADLEVLPFCGLPPYTPDRLIDLAIVDDHVSVRFAEYFSRPLRLTPAEGFALLAAGRALLSVSGSEADGPLASALDKLERALNARDLLDVDIGEPDHIADLRVAAERRERVVIDYYSFGRDAVTTRSVDPYAVVSLRGNWYLAAYCHRAGDDRLFRVDRVRGVRPTGETFEPREAVDTPDDVFHPSAAHTRVTVSLPASAAWVVENYPVESMQQQGTRTVVTLAVSERPWLERLLLSVGREGKVRTPKAWRTAGADAAARVLARYDEHG